MRRRFEPRNSGSRVKYLLLLSPRQAPGTLKNGTEHGRGHERANDAETREASDTYSGPRSPPSSRHSARPPIAESIITRPYHHLRTAFTRPPHNLCPNSRPAWPANPTLLRLVDVCLCRSRSRAPNTLTRTVYGPPGAIHRGCFVEWLHLCWQAWKVQQRDQPRRSARGCVSYKPHAVPGPPSESPPSFSLQSGKGLSSRTKC